MATYTALSIGAPARLRILRAAAAKRSATCTWGAVRHACMR
jgi:hypothetical protein